MGVMTLQDMAKISRSRLVVLEDPLHTHTQDTAHLRKTHIDGQATSQAILPAVPAAAPVLCRRIIGRRINSCRDIVTTASIFWSCISAKRRWQLGIFVSVGKYESRAWAGVGLR
jgi:hypothetical protein